MNLLNAQRRVANNRSNAWLRGDNLSRFRGRRILVTGSQFMNSLRREEKP